MEDYKLLNQETLEALKEVEEIEANSGDRKTYKTSKELFDDILDRDTNNKN